MPSSSGTILFAGGGTGGHIYPNAAIVERVQQLLDVEVHFLVSDRPGDAKILGNMATPYTASPAKPLPSLRKPWQAAGFARGWAAASWGVSRLLRRLNVRAVVATGGFVSGPAVVGAFAHRVPRVLVNLDAVPGQANRRLGTLCDAVFSTYATPLLPTAQRIGLPLRAVSRTDKSPQQARAALGLDAERPTLFATGATHGAQSLIEAMVEFIRRPSGREALAKWQVFHQCGTYDADKLRAAYDSAGVRATVVNYCDAMGLAWRAADIAVSRAGAGSVAEAWANATPTLFVPNPYHRDQHQRHNAQPLADAGGARIVTDHIDAPKTVAELEAQLLPLMREPQQRMAMSNALRESCPEDGAQTVAAWLAQQLG